jgi:hypothetical protein
MPFPFAQAFWLRIGDGGKERAANVGKDAVGVLIRSLLVRLLAVHSLKDTSYDDHGHVPPLCSMSGPQQRTGSDQAGLACLMGHRSW